MYLLHLKYPFLLSNKIQPATRRFNVSIWKLSNRTLSTMSENPPQCHSKSPPDIYVQTLPVIKLQSKSKILLCKWTSGNFKDRFTGLIKPIIGPQLMSLQANMIMREKRKQLQRTALDLLPKELQNLVEDIDLVGLLRFEDPPESDEYVYIANLIIADGDRINFNGTIPYGEHSCFWFDWENIPFHEMPADDALWYPKVLWEKQKVRGTFTFGGWAEKTIKSYELYSVTEVE